MSPLTVVDAHLHLWDPARFRYDWLAEVPRIAGPHGLAELDAALGGVALEAAVFVQCDCAAGEEEAEVRWVAELARADRRLRGIVAGVPLERGAAVRPMLERLAREPLVRGVRRLIQGEADPRFCLSAGFLEGLRGLPELGLSFDLCVRAPQLSAVVELVERVPEVAFVLDHLGKPDVRGGAFAVWRRELARLARLPNVVCKLSGLVTEADHARWSAAELAPYLDSALELFGLERVLYGSDWPVVELAGGYARWLECLHAFAATRLDEGGLRALLRDNARRVYRLG